MNIDDLRGRSNQDQELAEIIDTWHRTADDIKNEFVDFLSASPEQALEIAAGWPDQWVHFFMKCALYGIREAELVGGAK